MEKHQVQELIDIAIDKHNKTATLISASIGSVLLFLLCAWSYVYCR